MTLPVARLNYHHLHSFWAVAKDGQLVRAAQHLRVAPSALSTQVRLLEEELGQELFVRQGRRLVLTEAGQLTLAYADTIFATGQELVATLRDGRRSERRVLRVGAVATLSRNFQLSLLGPIVRDPEVGLVLSSGSLGELLSGLRAHALDLVLSNDRGPDDAETPWRIRRIARQPVCLVGPPRARPFVFPDDLVDVRLAVPGRASAVRRAFDVLCEQYGLRPTLAAEVDDMAMLRLLARDSGAVALVPEVVVRDELAAGSLAMYAAVPDLHEEFYAIAMTRQYQHPTVRALLARVSRELPDQK